ncbi:MAG: hypothetical protein LAP61_14150 [Acidobacteriia bacterium]|nr:hypothetical protein [Terriglobia bacterium]
MVPLVQAAKNTPLAAGQSQADAVEGVLRDNLDLSACMIDALPEDTRAGLAKSLAVAMEANRVDTQTGAGASAAGSTTLVSSGQTARLIGLAVEQGGILQSISGSTVTLRTNPVLLLSAFGNGGSVRIYSPDDNEPLVRALKKLNLAATFDTTRGSTTETGGNTFLANYRQLTQFSARYDFINHRDPNARNNAKLYRELAGKPVAQRLANGLSAVYRKLRTNSSLESAFGSAAGNISSLTDPAAIQVAIEALMKQVVDIARANPDLALAAGDVVSAWEAFVNANTDIARQAGRGWVMTAEYVFGRPPLTMLDATGTGASPANSSTAVQSPDLHTLRVIGVRKVGSADFTFNVSSSIFHQALPTMSGNFRDFQASAKLDIPVTFLNPASKKAQITLAGMFADLHQKPLGLDFVVHDTNINTPGKMGLAQAALTFPIGDSGVKIPLSLTYASRTELIDEKDVRASFGFTFDLESLLLLTHK